MNEATGVGRVLVVEDDENLRLALVDNLEDAGFVVEAAADVATAQARWEATAPDVVVLDIMLPDGDGYALCRAMRDAGSAAMVLMLTARTLEDDVVRGFEAGADDYLRKPYRLRELMARIGALTRRRRVRASTTERFGRFVLDRDARKVTDVRGRELSLTRTEHDLLAFLLRHQGRALSRDQILDAVWGVDVMVEERTVDNFVSSLKKKLRWSAGDGYRISTVRGVGYRMEVDQQAAA